MQNTKTKKQVIYTASKQKELDLHKEIKELLEKKNGIQLKLASVFFKKIKEFNVKYFQEEEIVNIYKLFFKIEPTACVLNLIKAKY